VFWEEEKNFTWYFVAPHVLFYPPILTNKQIYLQFCSSAQNVKNYLNFRITQKKIIEKSIESQELTCFCLTLKCCFQYMLFYCWNSKEIFCRKNYALPIANGFMLFEFIFYLRLFLLREVNPIKDIKLEKV